MKVKKKKEHRGVLLALLVATTFGLATTTAHATVTDWGVHDSVEAAAEIHAPGSFLDTFSFGMPLWDDLASTTVANNLYIGGSDVLHISDGLVNLFEGVYGDATPDVLQLSYAFSGTTGDTSHSLSGLNPGAYYYQVSGNADGSNGGFYTLTSTFTAAPVPEPETYGLLLAGLALMGIMARRRARGS